MLLVAAFFCLAPVLAFADGNTAPRLYLEVYQYNFDPDDPGPPPAEICTHQVKPIPIGQELQCFVDKAAFNFGIVPVHVGHLDEPIATSWPLPAGPGGGYVGLAYGLVRTGVAATFVGYVPCAGFLQGPSSAGVPAAIVVSATTACHDWWDHTGYCKFLSTSNLGATFFDIVANADLLDVEVINCQANLDLGLVVAGGAQWGGPKSYQCGVSPDAVNVTTWGKIKGLYQ